MLLAQAEAVGMALVTADAVLLGPGRAAVLDART
jgi:predicted nucleic acid-binding protein